MRGLLVVASITLIAALPGCGSSTGEVTGKVTLNGDPVGGAIMQFRSKAEAADVFDGTSNPDGKYYVDTRGGGGLPVGQYEVIITRYTKKDGSPVPPTEEGQALIDNNQAVVTTYVFVQDIQSGANPIDFELSKGQKQTTK